MAQADILQDCFRNPMKPSVEAEAPEARVLIIMTGGTICMERSADGFVPARGFLESGLALRPSFNDGSDPKRINAMADDHTEILLRSLRTPVSTYERHVRFAVLESTSFWIVVRSMQTAGQR